MQLGVPAKPAANIVRNAVIIGACAAVSAPTGARLMAMLGLLDAQGARQLRRVAALDDVMALLAVGLVTAAFRPIGDSAWQLPPLGWVFLQVGMGVALGVLVWVAVRNARNPNEDVAMTLGALAFSAGMAGYVGFSPLAVCFVSGMTAANVPGSAAAGPANASDQAAAPRPSVSPSTATMYTAKRRRWAARRSR